MYDPSLKSKSKAQLITPEVFNRHFEKLFNTPGESETLPLPDTRYPVSWDLNVRPLVSEVMRGLGRLKRGKAPGPDGLCPETIKAI